MEAKKLLTKTIAKLRQDLDEAESKLKDLEVTYSIGDRFEHNKHKVILGKASSRGVDFVQLVRLNTGETWNGGFIVKDPKKITKEEMGDTLGFLTRYWDNRKKVHV